VLLEPSDQALIFPNKNRLENIKHVEGSGKGIDTVQLMQTNLHGMDTS
jgi:hypothetical protein